MISDWLDYIENIFNECGASYIWRNQYFVNHTWLMVTIKTSLQDQFKQIWNANMQSSAKTLNYRLFKENLEFENYFNILDSRDIYTLCKFRLVNHKLPIERGRWINVNREDRKCELCDSNDLGDEFHYLLKCKFFDESRKDYIDKKYFKNANILKLKSLMDIKKKVEIKENMQLYSSDKYQCLSSWLSCKPNPPVYIL